MAVAVRGSFGSVPTVQSVSPAGTLPAGIQDGDRGLLMVGVNIGTATVTTPPAGWTLVDGPVTNPATNLRAWLYTRTMLAADSGVAVTATLSLSGWWMVAGLIVSGADAAEQANSWVENTDDTTLTIPAITPAAADELLVCLASVRYATTTTGVTAGNGWTERQDVATVNATAPRFGPWVGTRALTGQSGVAQAAAAQTFAGNARNIGWVGSFPATTAPPTDPGLRWFVHKAGALVPGTLSLG